MTVQKLFKLALGFSIFITSYATAAPLSSKATIIGDCSKIRSCPLVNEDIILTDKKSRSGLIIPNGMIFLGTNTRIKVITLQNVAQEFSLMRGKLGVRLWQTQPNKVFIVKTGHLKILMNQAGYYQIDVTPNGRTTTIKVIQGRAQVRVGNVVQVISKGATFKYSDNRYFRYRKINLPIYDDHYTFSLNFMDSYYRQYPIDAPPVRLIPKTIRGPKMEIIYHHPITIYSRPFRAYEQPVIVREPRYRRGEPAMNIDINLNRVFGEREDHKYRRGDRRLERDHQFAPKPIGTVPIDQKHPNITPPKPDKDPKPSPEVPKPDMPAPVPPKPDMPVPTPPKPEVPTPTVPGPEVPEVPGPQVPPEAPTPEVLPPDSPPRPETPAPEVPLPEMPTPEVPQVPKAESVVPSKSLEDKLKSTPDASKSSGDLASEGSADSQAEHSHKKVRSNDLEKELEN